jgi:DHA1 family bicyclomycin/chloramphenicol resistance-like MFS transporter
LYILSAPAFVYNVLGLGASDFPWLFAPGIIGVMSGAYASGRVAARMTQPRIISAAYTIMFVAAAVNLAYSASAPPMLPWSVIPIMIYTFGMAFAMPSLTLLALDLFPQNRGLAASLMGFEHSFVSALAAGAISPVLSHSALTLAAGMTTLTAIGWGAWRLYAAHQ